MTKGKDPVERQVRQIVNHPNYDVFVSEGILLQTNDIALLKIDPVAFNNNVVPICLPKLGGEYL